MTAIKLTTRRIEKVWGRHKLSPWFPDAPADGEPVGEIWYEMPGVPADAPELLVKFLFTSEKLSIQVHPDDAAAQAAGYPRGKDEAWVVLDVEPHATIGLGLTRQSTREELRAGALDGSIEQLVDWRPAKAGDVIYSPAGTVHALGPGLAIVEIQQNVDLTYRLYDYGRPRELHLDEGIAVSDPEPFTRVDTPRDLGEGRTQLVDGPAFRLERWQGVSDRFIDGPVWLVALTGHGTIGGGAYGPGEVWYSDGGALYEPDEPTELLVAYPRIAAASGSAVTG
ncbi:class I mannose-6-phosphate isomerase [Sphingoaurantiacus capsulatus]|uniref:Class I mannose-6-phosphate isomerase n=1 Tax=Sphingoaurantiacus capsulatus TaxID=1771310 RepID=A0ABV7XDU9_9SPHN